MNTLSILGAGWLGVPLGAALAADGWAVCASTTTPERLGELAAAGLRGFCLRLEPEGLAGQQEFSAFFASEHMVLSIPPGRRSGDVEQRFPAQVRALIPHLRQGAVRHVLFTSSTSVYNPASRPIAEEDEGRPDSPSGRALLAGEALLRAEMGFKTTVVRFGGLIGGNRHPARFLAGKKDVKHPDAPVNLIHRDDCIAIIRRLLDEPGVQGGTYNAVADAHPTRRAYYAEQARRLGLEPPEWAGQEGTESGHKLISNERLKAALGYEFLYPDPAAIPFERE